MFYSVKGGGADGGGGDAVVVGGCRCDHGGDTQYAVHNLVVVMAAVLVMVVW